MAGELDRRFRFEAREAVDDGLGNEEAGAWMPQFTVWCRRTWRRGGEHVLADRLAGRAPAVLRIRDTTDARRIGTDWRAIDDLSGEVFNIREMPQLTDDRQFREMLAETGVAT